MKYKLVKLKTNSSLGTQNSEPFEIKYKNTIRHETREDTKNTKEPLSTKK
jgi:hypothetical protein